MELIVYMVKGLIGHFKAHFARKDRERGKKRKELNLLTREILKKVVAYNNLNIRMGKVRPSIDVSDLRKRLWSRAFRNVPK